LISIGEGGILWRADTSCIHNLARAILKEPKIYFYDTGAVIGDRGAKLENAVAVCLRKWLHFLEDARGKDFHCSGGRLVSGVGHLILQILNLYSQKLAVGVGCACPPPC